jgi:hypothetical protein
MPGVAPRMLPVAADAEVIGYGARVNGVNGEIHSLVVNVLALSATRPATWAIFRSQTTLRARRKFGSCGSRSARASSMCAIDLTRSLLGS